MTNEEKILQMLVSMQAELSGFRSEVNERFDHFETDIAGLKEDVSVLKQDVDILKTQQRENTDIIKAIRHNQEHICAEINALKTHTASEESTIKIRASINALNERIFMQDTNIQELKLVNIKSTIAEMNDKLELLQAGDRVLNRRLFEQEANVVGIKRELHQKSNTSGE